MNQNSPHIIALSKSDKYSFHKYNCDRFTLLKGLGVEGDVHAGETVKHRSRIAKDPTVPNLRQVHLMHSELFDELKPKGFTVSPGELGENITNKNIELLSLPTRTILEITGLRNPCNQLNKIKEGLMNAVLDKDADGNLIRKAGIMSIVIKGGEIKLGQKIEIELPKQQPFTPLLPV